VRRARHADTGAPIEIGAIEKMSKSNRNMVAARARRDLDRGRRARSVRFVQRLWRLVNDAAEFAGAAPARQPEAWSEVIIVPHRIVNVVA
jgi:leucyl-tRNA synthetase